MIFAIHCSAINYVSIELDKSFILYNTLKDYAKEGRGWNTEIEIFSFFATAYCRTSSCVSKDVTKAINLL